LPKAKTRKSAAKRFKITGSGKILHRRAGRSHLLAKKSSARKRRLALEAEVKTAGERKAIRRLIPGI
jgi:large subunit ribosomal protein L35